jgi:hypothetical protein
LALLSVGAVPGRAAVQPAEEVGIHVYQLSWLRYLHLTVMPVVLVYIMGDLGITYAFTGL